MRRLALIALFTIALTGAYKYGKRIERIEWQEAVYGRRVNPHVVLATRIWDKLRRYP